MSPHRSHLALGLAVAFVLALTLPAGALAAGAVRTAADGEITYNGDDTANVLTVTATAGAGAAVTLVFSETGIVEGTDTANLCTPGTDTVTCSFDAYDPLTLDGNDGDDRLTLDGPVRATIAGESGADRLLGGDGGDHIKGGEQRDAIEGRGGDDVLNGELGADAVLGGDGNDFSYFDAGNGDSVDLGPGRDWFLVANYDGSGDQLRGGGGADTLAFTTSGDSGEGARSTVDLARGVFSHEAYGSYEAATDSLAEIEDAGEYAAGSGDDTLIGNAGSNVLAGGAGADTIVGGAGTDTLLGDKTYLTHDYLSPATPGADRIDAFDGFEDRVDCGDASDSVAADQFDLSLLAGCESVDSRQANPFGVAATPLDVRAPSCTRSKLGSKKRASFVRRGFSLTLTCDEAARVEATASLTRRSAAARSRAGDVVLGEKTLALAPGRRTLAFKVPRALRRGLGRSFTVRLRVDAIDSAGNRATSFASFKVR